MKPLFRSTLGSLCALGLALAGCQREPAGPPRGRTAEATPVTVATVSNAAWDKTVSIIGTLYPKDEATIGAQVEGSVDRTLVEFGDRLRAGQDLAFIDTGSYEAQLEQAVGNLAKAEATLTNARKNFIRTRELKKGGLVPDSEFDQAQAQADQGEAEVKAARGAASVTRLNVERSQVKAPFDGAVAQRLVGRGDFVKVGSPLFNLVNDSVLKFIFQVPERYASLVQKKLPVSFNVDNYPGETFTGSVYLISPSISTASRAFGVGALVTNTDFRLKANTFARGSLVLERAVPTPVVPLESVINFAGVTKVFVVEGSVARGRTVVAGRIRDGLQEILRGVQAGETVVVTGQNHLSDGAAVALPSGQAPPLGAKLALPASQATNASRHEPR